MSSSTANNDINVKEILAMYGRIDLRVGRMMSVKKHPSADKLYIEEVDFGSELGMRTVVSGLVPYFSPQEMTDRLCVFVANLKPAAMRGVISEAMVLVAKGTDGADVSSQASSSDCDNVIEFVGVPDGSVPGDRVIIDDGNIGGNAAIAPDVVLPPKKKIFESVQPFFGINPLDRNIVLCGKYALMVPGKGPLFVKHLIKGSIS